MSIRQGNNILAGGVVCDNTPTSGSQNAVSSGGVYTALSGKVDVGHQVIEFQEPTSANNYTWYRKYADGWVEQGGTFSGLTNGANAWNYVQVTLPVEMSDTNYTIVAPDAGVGSSSYHHGSIIDKSYITSTSFRYYYYNGSSGAQIGWYVCGKALS